MFEKVAQKLADLGISYDLVEHEPALTTEQADRFIEGIEKKLWNDKETPGRRVWSFWILSDIL